MEKPAIVKVRRYPLLRLLSTLYKLAASIVFLLATLLAILAIATSIGFTRGNVLLGAITGALGFVLAGGLSALSLYAIAQFIDLLLETNSSTRQLAEAVEKQNKLLLEQRIMLARIHRRASDPYPRA